MKHLILLAFLLAGCATGPSYYDMRLAQIKRMEDAVIATPPGPKRDEGDRIVKRMYDDLMKEIGDNEAMRMERRRTEAIESMADSMPQQNLQPTYTPSGY
jgi:hypothetical protein